MLKLPQRQINAPIVDYRKLRIDNLFSNEFKHLLYLLFWPLYGLMFFYVERLYPVKEYITVYSRIDDFIPFCEWFLIPYLFWFVYLAGMLLYTALYDIDAFKKMMNFIIITYTVTIVIYLVFPTCQELRPTSFERDNLLTRIMTNYYQLDTNTNVCPSIHVIGSLAVMFTSFHCKGTKTFGWKITFIITAILISISTVFLKQHSIIDIIAAIPLCGMAYYICFCRKSRAEIDR